MSYCQDCADRDATVARLRREIAEAREALGTLDRIVSLIPFIAAVEHGDEPKAPIHLSTPCIVTWWNDDGGEFTTEGPDLLTVMDNMAAAAARPVEQEETP